MKHVKIGQRIKCKRCEKVWHTRQTEIRMCPSCKSPYFDVPKLARKEA